MVYLGTSSSGGGGGLHSSSMASLAAAASASNGQGSNGHEATSSSGLGPERPLESSSCEEDEREGRIRVGKDYQVTTPPWIPAQSKKKRKKGEGIGLVANVLY